MTNYVTYGELYQFCGLLVAIIGLVVGIMKKK